MGLNFDKKRRSPVSDETKWDDTIKSIEASFQEAVNRPFSADEIFGLKRRILEKTIHGSKGASHGWKLSWPKSIPGIYLRLTSLDLRLTSLAAITVMGIILITGLLLNDMPYEEIPYNAQHDSHLPQISMKAIRDLNGTDFHIKSPYSLNAGTIELTNVESQSGEPSAIVSSVKGDVTSVMILETLENRH
ncbi:MAG: hypothetical protein HQK66_05405, partial [Desulfamplus sp.]|nr:hypothetical protein [Desulfamplus sp.]